MTDTPIRPEPDVRRVLIFRTGSIGDSVVALPAFHAVAARFPNARRVLLTKILDNRKAAPVAAILDHTGLIDDVMEYPDNPSQWSELAALRRRIRAFAPDLIVYLPFTRRVRPLLRDHLFFHLCGVHRIVGADLRRDTRWPRRDPVTGLFEYEGSRLLRTLGFGPIEARDMGRDLLRLTAAERAEAATPLRDAFGDSAFMALSIGAKTDVQQWGLDRWQGLVDALAPDFSGRGLLCIGSPDERAACDDLLARWRGPVLNLCGRLSPRASAAALERARLFVGNDSGPIHLAAVVGLRCVGVYSARNEFGKWFPLGDAHRIHYRDVPCRTCKRSVCPDLGKRCIREIGVDEVAASVRTLWPG